MFTLTLQQLSRIFPATSSATLAKYTSALSAAFEQFEINTPVRVAAFLGQVGVESGGFNVTEENLNYSKERLVQVFPKYFDAAMAAAYEHHPEAIANRVYANRLGNGNEASGDGWTYRGRGLIQLTGRTEYTHFSEACCIDPTKITDYMSSPVGAATSAGWYWQDEKLNTFADAKQFTKLSQAVNGGDNGLAQRLSLTQKALQVLTS